MGSLEDLDRLALAELDHGLLPARPAALGLPAPLRLRGHRRDVDREHVHLEQLLDGLADLRLVRVLVDLEDVLVVLDQAVALLGDDRCEQDLVRMEAQDALLCSSASAPSVTSSERAQTSAATSTSAGVVTTTRSRLRKDLTTASSSGCATSTSGSSSERASTRAAAALVEGSSKPAGSSSASVAPDAWLARAERSAAFAAFLFTLTSKLRIE